MSSNTNLRVYPPSNGSSITLGRPQRPWLFVIGLWALLANLACAQFVYINNNSGANAVSGFKVNAGGSLEPIDGSPFSTEGVGGVVCQDIGSITQVGSRLYVSNSGGSISGFDINPDGSLTLIDINPDPLLGPTFPIVGGFPVGVTASSDGQFLFVGRGPFGGGIDVFTINSVNGSLSLVDGSPFGVDDQAGFDVIYDAGRNNVISDVAGMFVSVFDVTSSGELNLLGAPFETPTLLNHKLALRPQGDCLFVAGGIPGEVSVIKVLAGAPYLENAPGSPVATGDFLAIGATVRPQGDFVYFGGLFTIAGFQINDPCALTPVSVYFGGGPFPGLTTDSGGGLLFAIDGANHVSSFTIDSAGGLTLVDSEIIIGNEICPAGGIVYVKLAAVTVPTTADACKNGGWKTLFRADGTPFKNQGDCVQYVNTGK